MNEPRRVDALAWLLGALALVSLANGAWMLVDPLRWYHDLPAGVPDTGPFNLHFVRDIGCAFVSVGAALAWAAMRPAWRLPLVGIATLFFVAHALLHTHDTLRGLLDAHHWWLDFPGVHLPALILVAVTWRLARAETTAG